MKCVRQLDGWEEWHFEGDHLHDHVVVCWDCDVAAETDDKQLTQRAEIIKDFNWVWAELN